jgi:sugar phosphate isomerase/epimerase
MAATAPASADVDVVTARDAAVLKAIRAAGPAGIDFHGIRAQLPKDEHRTDDQRRADVSNALTRLRVKQLAHCPDGGRWVAL